MPQGSCAVILAGGEGKRMKSGRPKALSPVLFKPMLQWVLDSAREAGVGRVCVVTGFLHEEVERYLAEHEPGAVTAYQPERKGTGHAVMMAAGFLEECGGDVLILNGDAPFIDAEMIREAHREHEEHGNSVTVVSAALDDPTGYGRVVRDGETHLVSGIVEQKDADGAVLAVREVNSGAYWFRSGDLLGILSKIGNHNKQGEYYLTDAVRLLIAEGKKADAYVTGNANAVLGANDCLQLGELNAVARERILCAHMSAGTEIPCRDGVIIGPDVTIGRGVCVLPGTILKGKTAVGPGCTIGPNTVLEDCEVGAGAVLSSVQGRGRKIGPGLVAAPYTVL
jgi:bifunctional UDP-N-acetylglucosamine pyrophosphorylase/glucosamine-1-phosphate N-acetyltransferase